MPWAAKRSERSVKIKKKIRKPRRGISTADDDARLTDRRPLKPVRTIEKTLAQINKTPPHFSTHSATFLVIF